MLLISASSFAQKAVVENLPKFDRDRIHFGFLLGFNNKNFVIHPIPDLKSTIDTLYVIEPVRQPGFNLGILADLRLGEYFNLRLLPDLEFASRKIDYTFNAPSGNYVISKEIESTFINFPLLLKYKSARIGNYRAYLVGGGKYSIDVASQKDVNSKLIQDKIVKVSKMDYGYEVGFGFDFYLPTFKFSPEIRFGFGVKNVLINEPDNVFVNSIDKLNSKSLQVSFLFE
jgi:hypothetical protein